MEREEEGGAEVRFFFPFSSVPHSPPFPAYVFPDAPVPRPSPPSRSRRLPRAAHPRGRMIVIAPTRAACETIELALWLRIETVLERSTGPSCASGPRPGRLRHRRRHRHRQDARHPADRRGDPRGDAPRRRGQPRARGHAGDADAGTSSSSPPASRAAGSRTTDHPGRDTLIVDEIHQTSAELELCLALGKRAGCRFIWLSATVDPTFYARVPRQRRRARDLGVRSRQGREVKVLPQKPREFLDDRFLRR